MAKKNVQLVNMKISDFNQLVADKIIRVRPTRLIPSVIKAGDEGSLTSIFLSAVRLIKEFREDIFSDLKIRKSGLHYFFTEPEFYEEQTSRKEHPDRPDGLILTVVSGVIKEAVLLEVKSKTAVIKDDQIAKYIDIAKTLGIKKILTISNQYVPDPSVTPVQLKNLKGVELYHYSWTALLTMAHVLLHKNDHNIADADQKALMKEVVLFLESKESGVQRFTAMKSGWKDTAKQITAGASPKKTDISTIEAIESWQQEEKDMALLLSQELGLLVKVGSKQGLKARFEADYKMLTTRKQLISKMRIDGIVSNIEVIAHFERRTITMTVQVQAPEKTIRGQIGWLKKQFDNCAVKNLDDFTKLKENLHIQPNLKYRNEYPLTKLSGLEDTVDELKGKEIISFDISYILHLASKFEKPQNFVEKIEEMLMDFYQAVVQHLSNPPKKIPQIKKQEPSEVPMETGSTTGDNA